MCGTKSPLAAVYVSTSARPDREERTPFEKARLKSTCPGPHADTILIPWGSLPEKPASRRDTVRPKGVVEGDAGLQRWHKALSHHA